MEEKLIEKLNDINEKLDILIKHDNSRFIRKSGKEGFVTKRREELGISQKDLAKMLGVSQAYICQVEGGKKIPSLRLGIAMAEILQCDVKDLFEEKEAI